MSVLSALALLAASAAKVLDIKRKPSNANIDALETKLDDLRAENARLVEMRNMLLRRVEMFEAERARKAQPDSAYQYQQMQNAYSPSFSDFCNCVPGRSQVWAAHNHRHRFLAERALLHALDGPIETLPQVVLDALTGTPSGRQDD